MSNRRDRRQEAALRRLDRRLARAQNLGAITAEEAAEIREDAKFTEYMAIIELIMMIFEMIREWFENRDNS